MKHSIIIFFTIFAALFFTSCHDKKHGDEPAPPKPSAPVERTVLVYMVAANNLSVGGPTVDSGGDIYWQSPADSLDINEMVDAAKRGYLNGGRLIVYHASYGRVVLKEITSRGVDTLKIYDKSEPSVSVSRMRSVIADVRELAPSRKFGMVLWSHANGWLVDGIDEPKTQRSYGLDNGKKMNISALAEALSGQDIDFLYIDCCYMGSVEAMYELGDAVPVIAASAAEVPFEGMPYDKNVKCFFAATPDLVTAAENTYKYYNSKKYAEDRTCTMAVIHTAGLRRLAELTRRIYELAPEAYPAGYSPQKFDISSRCYYFDLQDYVEAICTDESLLEQWRAALADVVVYKAATERLWNFLSIKSYCGLSTYIFSSEQETRVKGYDTTAWFNDVSSALLK